MNMSRRAIGWGLATVLVAASGRRARAALFAEDFSAVVARVLPAVVNIAAIIMPSPGSGGDAGDPAGSVHDTHNLGSGLIIDASGLIVTNRHVVDGASLITVTLQNGLSFRGALLASAAHADIALIKIDAPTRLIAVPLGDSGKLRVGEPVFAIGNPLGLGGTVTSGIISALDRDIVSTPYDDFIQTDAAINHGNSGGPLFDRNGNVIGINTAFETPGGAANGSVGLGFAIPSNEAAFVVGQLRAFGFVRAGWFGVVAQALTPELAEAEGLDVPRGAIISSIDPAGPAARTDLRPGDVVVAVNGSPIADVRALWRAAAVLPSGTFATLRVWRAGKPRDVKVGVMDWPGDDDGKRALPATGQSLRSQDPQPLELGARLAASGGHGVLVQAVQTSGSAMASGIRPGDVILQVQGTVVADPARVASLLDAARASGRRFAAVLVQRADGQDWVAVPLVADP
jgi:serine protease Do